MIAEPTFLFVYGTLRNDAEHHMHKVLRENAHIEGAGEVRGALFDLGEYPALALGTFGGSVRGQVFRLHDDTAEATLQILDAYEGCAADDPQPHEYARERVRVKLDGGRTLEALAYIYQRTTSGLARIPSGDYLTRPVPTPGKVAERPKRR